MENEILVILTTAPNMTEAQLIADTLVFERLAACVQIGAEIKSVYVWKSQTEKSAEIPLSIKTSKKCVEKLKERFMQIHSYECPQWICLKAQASSDYAKWVEECCI